MGTGVCIRLPPESIPQAELEALELLGKAGKGEESQIATDALRAQHSEAAASALQIAQTAEIKVGAFESCTRSR